MTTSVADLVEAIATTLESGDAAHVEGHITDDAVIWHNHDGREIAAKEGFAQARVLGQLVEGIHIDILRTDPLPDGAVIRFEIHGVVRASGQPLRARNCIFLQVRDGRIARIDEYVDGSFGAQLSAAPSVQPT